jgi:hypothetical protein
MLSAAEQKHQTVRSPTGERRRKLLREQCKNNTFDMNEVKEKTNKVDWLFLTLKPLQFS